MSSENVTKTDIVYQKYAYADEVKDKLWAAGLYADVDNGPDTMKKKILLGEQAQYNFIFGEYIFNI
jgi:threonyl-tRNA synthetase